MDDIIISIQTIDSALQCSVSLGFSVAVPGIFLAASHQSRIISNALRQILVIKLQISFINMNLPLCPMVIYLKQIPCVGVRIIALVSRRHLTIMHHPVPGPGSAFSIFLRICPAAQQLQLDFPGITGCRLPDILLQCIF